MGLLEDFGLHGYLPEVTTAEYTQDLVPIENIKDGIIITKDGRYVKIVQVLAINFETRPFKEKDNLLLDYQTFLSIAPCKMQIKKCVETEDPEELISEVERAYEQNKDNSVVKLMAAYIEKITELGAYGAVAKKFYLIYECDNTISDIRSYEDAKLNLMEINEIITTYLADVGNLITSFSGKDFFSQEETIAITEFLYKYMNPRTAYPEFDKPPITFSDRIKRLYEDTAKIYDDKTKKPGIDSLIAPMSVDFSKPDCIVLDGKYYSFLLVKRDGFPSTSFAGWFDYCFNVFPGESVDLFIRKPDKNKFLDSAGNKLKTIGMKLDDKTAFQKDFEQTKRAYVAAEYIKSAMDQAEEPFYITLMITLSAYRYEELIKRRKDLIRELSTKYVIIDPLNNNQEEAFRSSLPVNNLSTKIFEKGKRNIMTSGLSSVYPFTSETMHDKNGFMIGVDLVSQSMCILNPFDTTKYKNANMIVLGSSGAGKTYTLSTIMLRLRMLGIQCFAIIPEKAHEFSRIAKAVGGTFVKISNSSNDSINLLEIVPKDSRTSTALQGSDISENTIYVAEKAKSVTSFFSLLLENITVEEEQLADVAVISTYAKFGITEDNDSIYNPDRSIKKMPILSDLYQTIEGIDPNTRLLNVLKKFIYGSAKCFNRQTNVDMKNKLVIFDVSDLDKSLLPAGMSIVLDFIDGKIKEDIIEKKMVFIEEAWRLISTNAKAADMVLTMSKTIRGYSGGLCISTQNISDYFSLEGGKYGQAILANSQIKVLLFHETDDARTVCGRLGYNSTIERQITRLKRGQCLFIANSEQIKLSVESSDYEHQIITSDDIKSEIRREKGSAL